MPAPAKAQREAYSLWKRGEPKVNAYLKKAWPRWKSEHEDWLSEASIAFVQRPTDQEGGSAVAFGTEFVKNKAKAHQRNEGRRTELRERGAVGKEAAQPRLRGFARHKSGYLFPKPPPGGDPNAFYTDAPPDPIEDIGYDVRYAAESLLGLVEPIALGIDAASASLQRKVIAAYEAAYGSLRDEPYRSLARRLIAAISHAKYGDPELGATADVEDDDVKRVRLFDRELPARLVTDEHLADMYRRSRLGRGGGRRGGEQIEKVVLDFVNGLRKRLKLPALKAKDIGPHRANSRGKRR